MAASAAATMHGNQTPEFGSSVEAAADCLSRQRGLGPGLVPVGGEFQTRTKPHDPGGGNSIVIFGLNSFF